MLFGLNGSLEASLKSFGNLLCFTNYKITIQKQLKFNLLQKLLLKGRGRNGGGGVVYQDLKWSEKWYARVIGKHPVLTHAVDIGTAQLYSVPVTLIVIQNTLSPHCELSQLMQKFY